MPLVPDAIAGIDPSVPVEPPGVPNAVPLRLVGAAVRVWEAVEWLNTVITGLSTCPAAAVVAGGVMPVISKENLLSVLVAAAVLLGPWLPCV